MAPIRLAFLGNFVVEQDGKPVSAIDVGKERALLAYLALEHLRAHPREQLAGMLWPDKAVKLARNSLSVALHNLRRCLGESPAGVLETTAQTVQFAPLEAYCLDVSQFEQLASAQRTSQHVRDCACPTCLEALQQAADLYRGEFLADVYINASAEFEQWLLTHRQAYHQQAVKTLARLADGLARRGDLELALGYARRLVEMEPLEDAYRGRLMRWLYQLGQRSAALAEYEAFQDLLRRELYASPDAETQALYQEILAQTQPAAVPSVQRHNLPHALTALVGRQDELRRLYQMLASPDCRLVSLLGPGGIGKTSLALEAGRRLLPMFPDGVYLVDLETQAGSGSLLEWVLNALREPFDPSLVSLIHRSAGVVQFPLTAWLKDKALLLILDGFESHLEAAGQAVELLKQAPGLKILATSRARLNLGVEQVFWLQGLDCPAEGVPLEAGRETSAVRLFCQAARRVDSEFELNSANFAAVGEICRINQGLPLGIMLAASWCGMLAPQQIAAQARQEAGFLAVDYRDLPERHHSLQASFEHTWRCLTASEQVIFARLSVFQGAFSVQRAAQIAEASLDQLRTLRDFSLLQESSGRYRLHDLARQFAARKLNSLAGECERIPSQHSQVYMQVLADWLPRLRSRELYRGLSEIGQELTDILAAFECALNHGALEHASAAAWCLGRYFKLSLQAEQGRQVFSLLAEQLKMHPISTGQLDAWAQINCQYALFLTYTRAAALAEPIALRVYSRLLEQGAGASSLSGALGYACKVLGTVNIYQRGTSKQALTWFQLAYQWMSHTNDPWQIALALKDLCFLYDQTGDPGANLHTSDEALRLAKLTGDPDLLFQIKESRSYALMLLGDCDQGLELVKDLLKDLPDETSPLSQAHMHAMLGIAYFYVGDFSGAAACLKTAGELYDHLGIYGRASFEWFLLNVTENYLGDYTGFKYADRIQPDLRKLEHFYGTQALLCLLRGENEQAERFAADYNDFMRAINRLDMPTQGYALLGLAALRRGDIPQVRQNLALGLENGLEHGFFFGLQLGLSVWALLLAQRGQPEEALALYHTVIAHPFAAHNRLYDDLFGAPLRALSADLPPELAERAQALGAGRELRATAQQYWEKIKFGGWVYEKD